MAVIDKWFVCHIAKSLMRKTVSCRRDVSYIKFFTIKQCLYPCCYWPAQVLQQVWPFVGQYLEKLLVETIAPSIRASSTHLQTLSFTKVDMGDKVLLLIPQS